MVGSSYPYDWVDLSPEDEATLKRNYGEMGNSRDMVRSSPEMIRVGSSIRHHFMRIFSMEIRPDDVWIVTHPKCGTTWTQEMTWHIMSGVDLQTAKLPLSERSHFIDRVMIRGMDKVETDKYFDDLEKAPSPRLIKTHYPFEMLPPSLLDTCKVLFVSRNVKDTAVSYFHHENLMKSHDLRCDFITYAREIYLPGLCRYGGYFEMLESGWKRKNHPNMKFFWYEEMKKDQKKMLKEICEFINYNVSEEKIDELDNFMKFENFQKVSSSNKKNDNWKEGNGQFIRKGIVGDWINHFDQDLNADYNNWKEGKGQFIRKGIVGDWINHFDQDLNADYNKWIEESLDKLGIQDEKIRGYYNFDVSL